LKKETHIAMKKLTYLLALFAMFLAVNTTKAQSNLSGTDKVVLVKLDPSTQSEARAKINSVLTDGKLNGYLKAENSFIVTVADDADKVQAVQTQVLTVFPAAQFTVVSIQQANVLIENQRNAANVNNPGGQ
jgi:hypothetical protein